MALDYGMVKIPQINGYRVPIPDKFSEYWQIKFY
jgi:hypothetical protein